MWEQRLNAALHGALADSPRAQGLVAGLAGRSVEVQLHATRWAVVLHSHGDRLEVRAGCATPADARISGGTLALLALAGTDPEAVIRRGDVRVDGDAEVAAQFRQLAQLLRPDLEHELGRALGPVPAHLAVRALRGTLDWGRRAGAATLHNLADYLAHERQDLVPQPESEHLLRGAETLREQSDRLDARLADLEQRVRALRGVG
jgi:ubiquinone biosynthesis accessory factor UbiJ